MRKFSEHYYASRPSNNGQTVSLQENRDSSHQDGSIGCVWPIALYIARTLTSPSGHLFIYLLKAYSPVNRTGSPEDFSQVQILQKLNTIQNVHILQTKKHINIIQKLVPLVLLS